MVKRFAGARCRQSATDQSLQVLSTTFFATIHTFAVFVIPRESRGAGHRRSIAGGRCAGAREAVDFDRQETDAT
jgi:hypothetical protein